MVHCLTICFLGILPIGNGVLPLWLTRETLAGSDQNMLRYQVLAVIKPKRSLGRVRVVVQQPPLLLAKDVPPSIRGSCFFLDISNLIQTMSVDSRWTGNVGVGVKSSVGIFVVCCLHDETLRPTAA